MRSKSRMRYPLCCDQVLLSGLLGLTLSRLLGAVAMPTKRVPSHAGSWYSDRPQELQGQLEKWLSAVTTTQQLLPAKGIIAPHAGYSYSGPAAGHAYRHMDPSRIRRVFILGPSHHFYLAGCALTKHEEYSTPIGDLTVDLDITKELSLTGEFDWMSKGVDEDEHSIEMHLPYIVQAMKGAPHPFTIVPVLVGNLSADREEAYGRIFANYLRNPENFFVISSDFCHWGQRFGYTFHDTSVGEIYQSIEALDREGMRLIEAQSPKKYHKYQKQFGNTICGRHPIAVLLNALQALKEQHGDQPLYDLRFVHYAQSSKCRTPDDSSVSYASAILGGGILKP